MTDREYIESIAKMSAIELLCECLENPQYLTDQYYRDFRNAIHERYATLRGEL